MKISALYLVAKVLVKLQPEAMLHMRETAAHDEELTYHQLILDFDRFVQKQEWKSEKRFLFAFSMLLIKASILRHISTHIQKL